MVVFLPQMHLVVMGVIYLNQLLGSVVRILPWPFKVKYWNRISFLINVYHTKIGQHQLPVFIVCFTLFYKLTILLENNDTFSSDMHDILVFVKAKHSLCKA